MKKRRGSKKKGSVQEAVKKMAGRMLAAVLSVGMVLQIAAVSPAAEPADASKAESVSGTRTAGKISGYLFNRGLSDLLEYLDRGIAGVLGYSAGYAGDHGNTGVSKTLTFFRKLVGDPSEVALEQIQEALEKLSLQINSIQKGMTQDFSYLSGRLQELSVQESYENFHTNYYDPLMGYYNQYSGICGLFSELASAEQAYAADPTDGNKAAMEAAYAKVEALYGGGASGHDSFTFNFETDLQSLCMLLSPYDYTAPADLNEDPGNTDFWGANLRTGNLMESYVTLIGKQDAFESEAYNDVTAMYNVAGGTLACYLEALQMYVAFEAQEVLTTPAADLESRYGITGITSEQQKESYVDGLWKDYSEKYYKCQRALVQMISLHKEQVISWMRDYDRDAEISLVDFQETYKGYFETEYFTDSVNTSSADKVGRTLKVQQFKPLYPDGSSDVSYALVMPDPENPITADDLHYIAENGVPNNQIRSCDYVNLMKNTSNPSGYGLISGAVDLSALTGVSAYQSSGMNLMGFLKNHGITTDDTITFQGTADYSEKTMKLGNFLISDTIQKVSETSSSNYDEDFLWVNVSQMINASALNESNILVDCDDDLESREAVDAKHVAVLYTGTPSAAFRVQADAEADGQTYVTSGVFLKDGTELDPSKEYPCGTMAIVRLYVDSGHYITSLNLNNESDGSLKFDYITKWSSGSGEEYVPASQEESQAYFESLSPDEDGAYTFEIPVSWADSRLEVSTAAKTESDYLYTASIQRDTRGVVSFAGQTGLTEGQYHKGDMVDVTVTPYEGYTCTGISVIDAAGNPVGEIKDTTDSSGLALTGISKKAKAFSFPMPASGVTIAAVYENAYTVTLADNATKSLVRFMDPETGDVSENSVMTFEAGDLVELKENVSAGSYLSTINIVEHDTNDAVASRPMVFTDPETGKTATGATFVMPVYNVDVVAESEAFPAGSHSVTLDSGAGGSLNFVSVETDEEGKPSVTEVSAKTKITAKEGETVWFQAVGLNGSQIREDSLEVRPDNADPMTLGSGITAYENGLYSFVMGDANTLVSASFSGNPEDENSYYILREKYGQGTIRIGETEDETRLIQGVAGNKYLVTAAPAEGYTAVSAILLNSRREQISVIELAEQRDGTSAGTFTMPEQDCIVYVNFRKQQEVPTHTLTVQADGTGSGSVSAGQTAAAVGESTAVTAQAGQTITVSLAPGEKSIPTSLELQYSDGSSIQTLISSFRDYYGKQSGNVYTATIQMPNADAVLRAVFRSVEGVSYYGISREIQGSGTVDIQIAEGGGVPAAVLPQAEVTVSASAEDTEKDYVKSLSLQDGEGNVLQELYTDDGSMQGTASGTFAMPEQDAVVCAVFAQKENMNKDGDEYLIGSYEDLVRMAQNIQSAPEQYASASYRVTQDIDCGGAVWTLPIGTLDHPFNGTFNGNDYTISNLLINGSEESPADPSYTREMSLFGVIGEQGTVRCTSILDFRWGSSSSYAGGIAAVNLGLIEYCAVGINIGSTGDEAGRVDSDVPLSGQQAVISGIDAAGGIAALNRGIIRNSRNNAIVTGAETDEGYGAAKAGGIAGINEGTILNFYNLGHVFGSEYEGGVTGENRSALEDGSQVPGSGVIRYGYNGWALETGDNGEFTGQVTGNTLSTDITDVYYCGEGSVAGTDTEKEEHVKNSEFPSVTWKSQAEMTTQEFADELNSKIEGEDSLGTWTWQAGKNYGFPRIMASQLKQAVWTGENGITITGNIHPDAELMISVLKSTDTDYAKVTKAGNIRKILGVWDISLRYENGRRATFEGEVKIHIPGNIADTIKSKNLEVLHFYNDSLHVENFIRNEDGSVDLTVGHLSPFCLAETTGKEDANLSPDPDEQGGGTSENAGNKDSGSGTSAKNGAAADRPGKVLTGDQTRLLQDMLLLAAAAAAAVILAAILIRRRRKR